jgi:heat-inducible transcriptional repressor
MITNASGLAQLDARSREIFREVVEAFLESGEPVGSRTLSRRGHTGLSPASIRNTLADLASLGLLDSPHAMAGRRPTHLGLRFFVDSLLEIGGLDDNDRSDIEGRIGSAGRSREEVLGAASDLLSGLAGGAGIVATPSRHEAALKHAEFVAIGGGQALCVLVLEDGAVENRILATPPGMPASALIEATNFLSARFKGRTLGEVRAEMAREVEHEKAQLDAAAAILVKGGLAEWSGEDPTQGRSLIVRGRANLLQDAQAQGDFERVRRLFEDLEKSKELLQLLDLARDGEAVRIFIGAENALFSLSGSSVIVAPYMNAERKVIGALGVIGPTRLNYARVIPVVDYTARVVGRLLDGRSPDR